MSRISKTARRGPESGQIPFSCGGCRSLPSCQGGDHVRSVPPCQGGIKGGRGCSTKTGTALFVRVLGIGLGLTCAGAALAQPVVYVDVGATGANNGNSWTDAYADLQAALDAAEASGGAIHEIWVADGTYKPSKRIDPDDPRSATFQLLDGVAVYGGFAGTETSIDERDIEANPTILSGDFNGNDGPDFLNYEENAYHVLKAENVDAATILNGFTITSGNANADPYVNDRGGGLWISNATPRMDACRFVNNWAGTPRPPTSVADWENVAHSYGGGGSLYLESFGELEGAQEMQVTACEFAENGSSGIGGAVFVYRSNIALKDCYFLGNTAASGGGIGAESHGRLRVEGTTFVENRAALDGGAIAASATLSVAIYQSNFDWNTGSIGGAVSVRAAEVSIDQSEFRYNEAETRGGAVATSNCQSVQLASNRFNSNVAEDGGAVDLGHTGNALLTGNYFSHNDAWRDGGAICFHATQLDAIGNEFQSNLAWARGGGLAGVGVVRIVDTLFNSNSASIGGGLSLDVAEFFLDACRFRGNAAALGGAIDFDDSEGAVSRSRFWGNTATYGGAVSTVNTVLTVANSQLTGNSAEAFGGAVSQAIGYLFLQNSTVAYNTAGGLGAGMLTSGPAEVVNAIFWANAVGLQDGNGNDDEFAQIEGLRFAEISHSCVQGWTGLYGDQTNFGNYPLFVDPLGPDSRPGNDDDNFNLRSESPCINAGLTKIIDWGPWYQPPPNLDLDGKPRVLCNSVDMGAYEFGVAGDVDCDLHVDLDDFSLWSECAFGPGAPGLCPTFDFDGDGDIDLRDAAALFRAFSPTQP